MPSYTETCIRNRIASQTHFLPPNLPNAIFICNDAVSNPSLTKIASDTTTGWSPVFESAHSHSSPFTSTFSPQILECKSGWAKPRSRQAHYYQLRLEKPAHRFPDIDGPPAWSQLNTVSPTLVFCFPLHVTFIYTPES